MTQTQKPVSRRGFVKVIGGLLGAVGLGAFVGPGVAFFWPKKLEETPSQPVPVGPADSIKVGEYQTVSYGRYPAIVLNTPNGIRTYRAVCTHFACLVKYNGAEDVIECPCHAGFFRSDDGTVISGPPPKELKVIPWFIEGDTLYIGGEA